MHSSRNSNEHTRVLFLARSIRHPEEFTSLHVAFLGATRILLLEPSGLTFRHEISWQQVLLH